jgi:hypothetical protein
VATDLSRGDGLPGPFWEPSEELLRGVDLGLLFWRGSCWAMLREVGEDAGHCDLPVTLGLEYQTDGVALNVRFAQ